jgi:membrane-associated phospholipid phosphatase
MPQTWNEAVASRKFLIHMACWLLGLALFIIILPHYFNKVLLNKPGIHLNDFFLNSFTPRDWSIEIFILIFGAPALFFLFNFRSPEKVLISIQCYVVVNFLRITSLYLFTLEAPEGIIPLVDPFLAKVAYGGNAVFVKDLFFSGHTSTLFLVFLVEKRKALKAILLISTLLVGLLLIWQRVHYTVDVLGAIFVTWVVFLVFTKMNAKIDFIKIDFQAKK